jgi:hypothetical protein
MQCSSLLAGVTSSPGLHSRFQSQMVGLFACLRRFKLCPLVFILQCGLPNSLVDAKTILSEYFGVGTGFPNGAPSPSPGLVPAQK